MNLRITTLLFGLLLTTLWVFGLMIAHKKAAVDQTAIVPTMQGFDVKVDKIVIEHAAAKGKEPAKLTFEQIGDRWFLKEGKQQLRVEGFRMKEMIDAVTNARQEDAADLSRDLAFYGLQPPLVTVKLSGKVKDEPKDWTLFLGKESPEKNTYYANSSERSQKAFAVPKRSFDAFFTRDVSTLRSKRLFDFIESGVTGVEIKKGDKKLEVKRTEGNLWVFVEPKNLGFIGYDTAAPEEKKEPDDPFHKNPKKEKAKDESISGIKALLNTITKVTVDDSSDFLPLGTPLAEYDLDAKTAPMRIEITTTDDAKAVVKDTLLVGKKVPNRKETFYYARLASDDGVFMLNSKWIEPLEKALADPGKLRSLDLAVYDPMNVDHVVLKDGKQELQFFMPENRLDPWVMFVGAEKKKSSERAVTSLIKHLLGKKAIVAYLDVTDADKEKKLAEWGLKTPAVEVAVYIDSIDKAKMDETKDEKEKKDEKDKKADTKKDKMPALKKDVKPALKLEFGKVDKDLVYVRRTLENGTESYVTLNKEFLDKIIPATGVELAYLDTEVPVFASAEALSLKLDRKTDKGTETTLLERHLVDGKEVWYVKDPLEPTGLKLADSKTVNGLVGSLAHLQVKKWVTKFDEKDDIEKYGLKTPAVVVSIKVMKHPEAAATLLGALANDSSQLAALGSVIGHYQAAKGETVTIAFGKETTEEKDKPGTFAKHSGAKMIFLADPQLVKFLNQTDLRDRGSAMNVQGRMIASFVGITAGEPLIGTALLASPYITGQVLQLDADKIKELRISVRTPFELRSFNFERTGKDKEKTWTDKSGLQEFQLDPEKVKQVVKDFVKLHADRFVAFAGGPRGEHKLGPKDYTVKLDLVTEDGKTVTLLVGATYLQHGHYANISTWPETVFMIPTAAIEPLLRGASHFAKERSATN